MNDSKAEKFSDSVADRKLAYFLQNRISDMDLPRAAELPPDACPRRYCWWWRSSMFEWNLTVSEGCTFLKSEKPPGTTYGNVPCCRSDPSSNIDHFEPNEPYFESDQMDASRWLQFRTEKNAERLPQEQKEMGHV